MRKILLSVLLLTATAATTFAQRQADRLDRGLVAMKSGTGVYLSWRVLGEEYYDVTYNVYRDGVKLTDTPLAVSNYRDAAGTTSSTYTVTAVVRGAEQSACITLPRWPENMFSRQHFTPYCFSTGINSPYMCIL